SSFLRLQRAYYPAALMLKSSKHTTGTRSMRPPEPPLPWARPLPTPGAKSWTPSLTGHATVTPAHEKLETSAFQWYAALILLATIRSISADRVNGLTSPTARPAAPPTPRAACRQPGIWHARILACSTCKTY